MIEQLESNYDCANASKDLPELQHELSNLMANVSGEADKETQERINRLENQIDFIKNKCRIRPND
ncbi:DUF2524 domain-containing protein [Ammoniphilus sp. YIM 78166]|uniref:DUF2524 domain-containing protein n=1 Tax=Ammoniphilus sp. YIM 78166 TaxID=1644106 RepID=UPI00106F7BC4|nr:DUF2524 domain-containing protein [Ammoniphilus sp. YIM 78166]